MGPVTPCFDGWTTNASGPSTLFDLTHEEAQSLAAYLPDGSRLQCVHQMPDQTLIVLYDDAGRTLSTVTLRRSGDRFEIVERAWVVGSP